MAEPLKATSYCHQFGCYTENCGPFSMNGLFDRINDIRIQFYGLKCYTARDWRLFSWGFSLGLFHMFKKSRSIQFCEPFKSRSNIFRTSILPTSLNQPKKLVKLCTLFMMTFFIIWPKPGWWLYHLSLYIYILVLGGVDVTAELHDGSRKAVYFVHNSCA